MTPAEVRTALQPLCPTTIPVAAVAAAFALHGPLHISLQLQ